MESIDRNEILNNFIAVTQCSNEEATRYLEAAQWNPQTAMEIFFDDGGSHASGPTASTNMNINQGTSAQIASGGTGGYESDDESPMQTAIDESLRASAAATKSISTGSKDDKNKNTSGSSSSKFGTIGSLHKEEDSSDEEGQAFYAGGSERSGQQILGPPKAKDTDKKVAKIFEAARKQGAVEADDENGSSSQTKKEKVFAGVGYTLGDDNTPSRPLGQSISDATTPASNRAEQLPLRFFSNGFTIGDGELRKFEDNKEFMNYIKRGEVPPELRNLTSGGRQIEVRLEDHREEEYKPVAPQFKPFGGAGYMLGSPAPTVVSPSKTTRDSPFQSSMITTSSSTTSASNDSSDLEKRAEQQLKSSSASTTIRLRLPDLSTPIRIAIDLNRTLADVRKFLSENVPALQSNQFQFIEPPSTKIKHEDETKTISEAKLTNATLAIRRGS
ncbi:unnamed protein product [Rotaria sordida]|uniref:NSFL1 cofactor p47 n=1 Tax=Rotaria sordida TaxID=392033 RepID=A0A813PZB7_9BILA|nr:unnamed protein product [Rotaria sordida]CAF1388060.1 unnamed protein product [Rotaria sordida]